MAYNIENSLVSYAVLMALLLGFTTFSAFAEQAPAEDVSEQSSLPTEPLTNFEKMELHHRRYITAANNMAQLFKQLNQKIQEVSLAAKTADAKNNSHNRRQLETKLRLLEDASATYGIQYSQLQSQMQNEYRNYMALSNDLKNRYDTVKDSKNRENAAKDGVGPKAKPAKNKEPKGKEGKETKETRETKARGEAKNIKAKARETRIGDLQDNTTPTIKDPRLIDLDPNEVRARRDGIKDPASATVSGSTPGPTLNIIR